MVKTTWVKDAQTLPNEAQNELRAFVNYLKLKYSNSNLPMTEEEFESFLEDRYADTDNPAEMLDHKTGMAALILKLKANA
jgi:hypothetical protein